MNAGWIADRVALIEDEAQALVRTLDFVASEYDRFLSGLVVRLAAEVLAIAELLESAEWLAAKAVPVPSDPDAAADRAAERAERDAWLENYREGWAR